MDIKEAKHKLKKGLKDLNLRHTQKRVYVLEMIFEINSPFTAEEIYKEVKHKGVIVSRATVYNTLGVMSDFGIITPALRKKPHRNVVIYSINTNPDNLLLEKYMRLIYDEESITFIENINDGYSRIKFTEEEVKELRLLHDKIVNED